jgi:hypothetical protein
MNFVLILLHFEYDDVMMMEETFFENYYLLIDYFLMEMINVDVRLVWEMKNVQHVYEIYLDLNDSLIIMFPISIESFIFVKNVDLSFLMNYFR